MVFPCPSALTEDAVEGAALGTADVVETTLVEATAGAAVAVGGRSLLSAEALPSWSSSVSSESSESESRVGASFCEVDLLVAGSSFLPAGGGDGEGEGELRESRDKVEPAIVVADDEEDNEERKQNTGLVGACARINSLGSFLDTILFII